MIYKNICIECQITLSHKHCVTSAFSVLNFSCRRVGRDCGSEGYMKSSCYHVDILSDGPDFGQVAELAEKHRLIN